MNKQTLGTCGNCGGAVTVDTIYWSVVPPTPRCEGCGSIPAEAHGPVIPMQGRRDGMSKQLIEYYGTSTRFIPLKVGTRTAIEVLQNPPTLTSNENIYRQLLFGNWCYTDEEGNCTTDE